MCVCVRACVDECVCACHGHELQSCAGGAAETVLGVQHKGNCEDHTSIKVNPLKKHQCLCKAVLHILSGLEHLPHAGLRKTW